MSKNLLIILILLLSISSGLAQTITTSTINYDSTSLIFPNPERGFSAYRAGAITLSFIDNLRLENITVIQRIYTIPQFINSPLSNNFLNIVEADFNTARDGGAKLVLRFSYTDYQNGEDAPLDRILEHIEQLKPLFQKHYDVIAYIEAGFIGAWGEWYYSSNNLNNTQDRRAILF